VHRQEHDKVLTLPPKMPNVDVASPWNNSVSGRIPDLEKPE